MYVDAIDRGTSRLLLFLCFVAVYVVGISSCRQLLLYLLSGRYDREGGRCSGVIRHVFSVASPTLVVSDRVTAQVGSLKCCVFECSTVHRAGRYEHVADRIAWKLTVISQHL